MAGKKFAAEFALRRNVSALDKILIQDSDDDVVKYAYPPQIAALSGYAYAKSIADLPLMPSNKSIGYIVGQMLYIYVGMGGDTKDGLYQSVGFFVGPQGVQGEKGEKGERGEQGMQGVKGDNGGLSLQEVDAHLATKQYVTADTLAEMLAGYVSNTSLMRDYVTIAKTQDVTGVKNFTAGVQFGGLSMYKSKDDTVYLDANLVVRGAVTMYGLNTTTSPSIFSALPIDGTTIGRNEKGELYVIGGTGGGSGTGGGISIADVESYLTTNGYATQSWVTTKGYITSTSSITGNAASATKLQNAVSLWGRSFDGTAALTGSLTVTTGEGYRINYNGYDLRFIVSGSSANRGIWDNTLNSWMMYRDDTENVRFPKGNVGIGDASPSYKLHVRGTLGVSDVATFAGKINLTSSNSHISIGDKEILGSYLTNYYLFDSAVTNGYTSFIVGKNVKFQTGTTTKTTVLTIDEKGDVSSSGVLKLPAVDSGFTNPRITFGDSVIRIGATTAGLLGIYASGDIRLNPNSVSASGTTGLWLKTSGFNGVNISNPTQALHVNGKGIFADATNPWVSLQRDGVNWYLQVTSGGLRLGRTSANAVGIDETGNLQTPGAITMFYSSDKRLKENIRKVDASKMLMSLGGVYQYNYIDSEVQKNSVYGGKHYGLIYQNVKGTALSSMCHEREDGYGSLNYLDTNFISLIAGATMENISEVEKLNRKIRTLEAKVKQLESRA